MCVCVWGGGGGGGGGGGVWVWIVEEKGKEMRERIGVGGFCQHHSRHPMWYHTYL